MINQWYKFPGTDFKDINSGENAMDLDDAPKRKDTPMEVVEAEKFNGLSVDELAYRIRVLKRETLRSKAELKEKAASKAAAEDVFKR